MWTAFLKTTNQGLTLLPESDVRTSEGFVPVLSVAPTTPTLPSESRHNYYTDLK